MIHEWRRIFTLIVSKRSCTKLISALCYHGLLRISTGLSLLEGMIELQKRAEEINIRKSCWKAVLTAAIRLIHGTSDRATSPHATLKLYERLPNEDKEIELYEGYEHGKLIGFACCQSYANVSDDEGWD